MDVNRVKINGTVKENPVRRVGWNDRGASRKREADRPRVSRFCGNADVNSSARAGTWRREASPCTACQRDIRRNGSSGIKLSKFFAASSNPS